jgi:hypothetical protein
MNGEKRNACRIARRKVTTRKTKTLVDNIKMGLRETGWGGIAGPIWLMMGPVEACCEDGNEPSDSIKCWEVYE